MTGQTRVAWAAAMVVAGVIGGVTLLDGRQAANTTTPAAPAATGTVVTSTAATTAPTIAPTTAPPTVPPPPDEGCAATGPSAAIDRDVQRGWLCLDGYITTEFAVSTAWSMPDPGVYQVYAKDRTTSSSFGDGPSTLKNFVAFSYGKNTGARVAFHSIPILPDGSLMQPIESVGDLSRRGESSGCIRVIPEISELIWDTLSIGDTVTVVS